MSGHHSGLSVTEKLDLVPAILSVTLAACYAAVEWPFRRSKGNNTFAHHVIHAIVRKFSRRLSDAQARWIEPSFESSYLKWCSSQDLQPAIIDISPLTRGFWLGNSTSKVVLVFFHGGGFAFPGNNGHINFLASINSFLKSWGHALSILMVEYPLTPDATFPSQFQEAVGAVRYVIETTGHEPSQIILGGDSAGGNLVATVILHCMHPADHASPLPKVSSSNKLKGAILISPWVSFDTTLPSFSRHPWKDYIQAATEQRWSDSYVGTTEPSRYSEPALASASDWSGLPVEDVLVTAGADEALIDGITQWVTGLQAHNTNVTYHVAPHEPHEAPIIWAAFRHDRETDTGRKIKTWLQERL